MKLLLGVKKDKVDKGRNCLEQHWRIDQSERKYKEINKNELFYECPHEREQINFSYSETDFLKCWDCTWQSCLQI